MDAPVLRTMADPTTDTHRRNAKAHAQKLSS